MEPHLILKKYFLLKKKINPRYSLRSFALRLKVNPAFISRILNGKQEIPLKRLEQITDLLGMDSIAVKDLKRSIAKAYLNELGLGGESIEKHFMPALDNYEDKAPTDKEMSVLSPWYNITIMEMTTCKYFNRDATWIAKKLNLTENQVEKSIDYLTHNGYLKLVEGNLVKTNKQIRIPTKKSFHIVRQFHKSMVELAIKEMFQNTNDKAFTKRLITSTSIAVNSKNLPRAKVRLAEMQLELAEILREGNCDQVYDLSLILFPITKD